MKTSLEEKFVDLKDPGIWRFMVEGEQLYPQDAVDFSMNQQRAFYDTYSAYFRKPRPAGVEAVDFTVGRIACRRYVPAKIAKNTSLLYLHGGGFVVGGLESHDDICAELAIGAGVTTTAVQYRLAPEHPFPAALEDCWAVLKHLAANGQQIVVAGDSAGGNLAAALCLKARDEGGPAIKGQVLIYPGLGGDISQGSYISQSEAPGLSTKDVLYYRDIYKGGGHAYAEPLKAQSHAALPQAFMVAAELDPLHDDCEAYATKLKTHGIAAEVRHEPLLVHSFLRARHMSSPASESFNAIIAAIKRFAA